MLKRTFQFKFCGNSEYVGIRTSVEITTSKYVGATFLEETKEDDLQLLKLLETSEGIIEATSIRRYSITCQIDPIFDRLIVLNKLWEILSFWLELKSGDKIQWLQKETDREDLRLISCRDCKKLQDEAFEAIKEVLENDV